MCTTTFYSAVSMLPQSVIHVTSSYSHVRLTAIQRNFIHNTFGPVPERVYVVLFDTTGA